MAAEMCRASARSPNNSCHNCIFVYHYLRLSETVSVGLPVAGLLM